MKHKKTLIFTVFIFIGICGFGQVQIENEIIASLIKSEFIQIPNDTIFNKKGEIKKIRISAKPEINLIQTTETFLFDSHADSLGMFKNNGLPSLDSECHNDFIEKNKSKIKIDTIPDFNGTINYLTSEEIKLVFKQGGWENYHKLYEFRPLVKISRPGLNKEKNEAFIYYSSLTDGLAGTGWYLLLKKVDNKWILIESMLSWIA